VHAIVEMVKNTHMHPTSQALHFIGSPFYAIGLAMTLGHLVGLQTDLPAGIAMWTAALAMFMSGHMIEGNIRSMTPVLLFRMISKFTHNFVMQRVHLFRT